MKDSKKSILNVPNSITFIRLILIIPIIYFLYNSQILISIILIVISILMDSVDGYFARKLNQRTRFGEYFDPLVDGAFTIALVLFFIFRNPADAIYLILIIFPRLIGPLIYKIIAGDFVNQKTIYLRIHIFFLVIVFLIYLFNLQNNTLNILFVIISFLIYVPHITLVYKKSKK